MSILWILNCLTERRVEFDITFIFTVLNGAIDASDLFSEIWLAVVIYYL